MVIPSPEMVVEAMKVVINELVDVVEIEEELIVTAGMEELEVEDEPSKLICTQ